MKIIEQNIDMLRNLCQKFHVNELYLFGSFAKGNFSETSDIDFLVNFSGVDPVDYYDNYFDFKENLKNYSPGRLI